ncbi:uncharacterized protein LOC142165225 [Nicotiana tabacum]|uniref:Uncharacterized protein LOC142165225 n=1 Tax=Nicotiana tabacum TaxID=4097 RepID=A0AC58S4L0_TOBAC
MWKTDIYCLQEIKVEGDIEEFVKQLWANRWVKYECLQASDTRGGILMMWDSRIWANRWVKYECLQASDTRGGILMMWDSRIWKGEVTCTGLHSLTCNFMAMTHDFSWHLTGVYDPNSKKERQGMWEEIGAARGLCGDLWVVCGDFITPRIDRFLISTSWNEEFRSIKQSIQQRVDSDHFPLSLQRGDWKYNKSYCKFENWWLGVEGFNDQVKTWWDSFVIVGRPDYILASKLKALKGKLKEWNLTKHENLEATKSNILNQISELDIIQEAFEEVAKNEEIAWRQRSRALWLKEGDKNTKFFQRTANAHNRYNNIDQLVANGVTLEDPLAIKEEVVRFYQQLFTESEH